MVLARSIRCLALACTTLALLAGAPAAHAQNNLCDVAGEEPDVIVGAIYDVARHGTSGGITAYSIGTESCNIGSCWALWISGTPNHPVIGQTMYRLKGGRFEQIGQSWLKHSFATLDNNLCGNCVDADGSHLGVNCSDPYGSGLNGSQSSLGPKFEVNAWAGTHLHPYTGQGATGAAIYKRLQVRNTDLDPAQNAGALYFLEAQYVTADDAAAGNHFNNSSYRRVTVGAAPNFNLTLTGATFQQFPAISAWAANEAGVVQADVGGQYVGAVKVTSLGGGVWHYEYALENLISHDSAQAVRIPIPHGAVITNIGFHDVDYHSGEPYSGTDWTATIDTATSPNALVWSTETFAQNPNANALRWGTLYNFRFDINVAPVDGKAQIVAFRPGGAGPNWRTSVPDRCGDDYCDLDESQVSCAADCTLTNPEAGAVPETSLQAQLQPNGDVTLTWAASCMVSDGDYEVYEGTLGDFDSHVSRMCSTGTATTATLTPAGSDSYYLVVPTNGTNEGSYGLTSAGDERPAAIVPCRPKVVADCP